MVRPRLDSTVSSLALPAQMGTDPVISVFGRRNVFFLLPEVLYLLESVPLTTGSSGGFDVRNFEL